MSLDVFFDTEATLADPEKARFLCGCAYWKGELFAFDERQIEQLALLLDFGTRIFVFNGDYDYTLMRAHGIAEARVESWLSKTVDFFDQVRAAVGVWPSLDAVALANGVGGKSSSGGEINSMSYEEMVSYCGRDVEIMVELAELEELKIPISVGPRESRKHVGECLLNWRTGAVSGTTYF